MSNPANCLPPGFRFHPTDEELIQHYLKNRAALAQSPLSSIIAEVDIYKFNPWDLPAKAVSGDRKWYFFSPRDRKYPNGVRPNRSAGSGYWKATGTGKPIQASTGMENIGVKKALVFYKGKPPKGMKTSWIMHEYRLAEAGNKPMKLRGQYSMRLDDWVLCRIYKRSNNPASVPPLIDQEQEDSKSDMPTLQTITQENDLKVPKSFSISESLDEYSTMSRLFDAPLPEILPGFDYDSFTAEPYSNQVLVNGSSYSGNGSNCLAQKLFETQQHHVADENPSTLKRQRTNDSCLTPNFSNHFDSLFNQQLLFNSYMPSLNSNMSSGLI